MGLKQKVVKGVFWSLVERFSTQAVSFLVSLLLARLLCPTDYGTVALLTIFISVAGVLVDTGFGNALIQKKDATDLEFNSVFYLGLTLSGLIYLVLFVGAPYIARFYGIEELRNILRVSALILICHSVNSVQIAELNRKMLFHLSFKISLLSTASSGIVGVVLAYLGFGPWALVFATLTSGVVGVFSRWCFIAWRPKLMFSVKALKPLFSYGWKLTVSSFIDVGFNNLYGLLIGKLYSRADLAYVQKGRNLPELMMTNINGTLGTVAFPALSQLQDDKTRVKAVMRRMIGISTYFVFPLMGCVALVSNELIPLLFGNQWVPSIPYMRLACFMFALYPFHTVNLQALQAVGRSDIYLKLEIIKKVLGLALLVAFISRGVFVYMAIVAFVSGPISVVINAWPMRRVLGYTVVQQLKDVLPIAAMTIFSGLPCLLLAECSFGSNALGHILMITVQSFAFLLAYIIMSISFVPPPVKTIFELIGPRLSILMPNLYQKMNKIVNR